MMRSPHIRTGTVFIVLMLATISFLHMPGSVNAVDQSHNMVDFFSNPSGADFNAVEWNRNTYYYAIAAGKDSFGAGVIYRYEPENGWTQIYSSSSDIYYDVAYDTHSMNDTFYVIGESGGNSCVLRVDNARDASPSITPLPTVSGYTFIPKSGVFDSLHSSRGLLVVAGYLPGTPDRSMIAWYDVNSSTWGSIQGGLDERYESITYNEGHDHPLFVVVGNNQSSARGIAYAFNYSSLWDIEIPPECKYLSSVSWYTPNPDGYAIAVGETGDGRGVAYRIDVEFPGARASYADSSSPYSLKFVYGSNEGHILTPVVLAYANFTSIAVDSRGLPHIAYYDSLNKDLVYVHFNGKQWVRMVVDRGGDVGMYCSIATGYMDGPFIAYYDATNGFLKMAWTEDGMWKTGILDYVGNAGKWTDMVIGSDYHIHISYISESEGLRYAHWNGTSWSIETVDAQGGGSTSIALDSINLPHIVYQSKTYSLEYRHYDGNTWTSNGFSPVSLGKKFNVSIDINRTDQPHIAAFTDDNSILYRYLDNTVWQTEYASIGPATELAVDGEVSCSKYSDNSVIIFSYRNSTIGPFPYAMSYMDRYSNGTWSQAFTFDYPDTGVSPSVDMSDDYHMRVTELPPVDQSAPPNPFLGVAWSPDGREAMMVGAGGQVYFYYPGKWTISLWNSGGPDLFDVATKPKKSPSYSIAVGSGSYGIISPQVADTSTTISADSYTPHINQMNLTDPFGTSYLNRQLDVGSTYTFFFNTSYRGDWSNIQLNLTVWFDNGDDSNEYNSTPGKNLNFKLTFLPDSTDPYNNSGTWKLLWPDTEEVILDSFDTIVVDNPTAGTPGSNDGQDYYLLRVNLTFGPQLAHAPGDGSWDSPTDTLDPALAFNDIYSWNINATIYDRTASTSRESRYDEFGIYAYTEISALGNPSGSGAPGSMISLSPESHIYVRTNVPYNITVNITDLKNSTGFTGISRDYIEVINQDPNSYNTSANTDLYVWTPFSGNDPLYVWGTASGNHLFPLEYGTFTAGDRAGYSSSPEYTIVAWRMYIPPGTPEDEYTAVITFRIDYLI